MPVLPFWIFPSFFLTAMVYALIGFGGGSSYLAFLAMTPLPLYEVAAIALFCNLIVAGGGVWHFSKAGQMRWKKLIPFLVSSIPAAYWGGLIKADDSVHRMLLGICLFFVAWRIGFWDSDSTDVSRKTQGIPFIMMALITGGALGFLSGFLGIGGGIFLSPILILTGWATVKEASAAASLFILLNSAAGLLARLPYLGAHLQECMLLGSLVFAGGQWGSRLGAYHLQKGLMQKLLAGFISWVGLRLTGVIL